MKYQELDYCTIPVLDWSDLETNVPDAPRVLHRLDRDALVKRANDLIRDYATERRYGTIRDILTPLESEQRRVREQLPLPPQGVVQDRLMWGGEYWPWHAKADLIHALQEFLRHVEQGQRELMARSLKVAKCRGDDDPLQLVSSLLQALSVPLTMTKQAEDVKQILRWLEAMPDSQEVRPPPM